MNDTLLGVLVGGFLGWIAPLITLRYGEKKWRLEARLSHLKAERDRICGIYEKAIEVLEEKAGENHLPIGLVADFIVLMPDEVRTSFDLYFSPEAKDAKEKQMKFLELLSTMKRDLRKREQEIEALFRGVA